MAVGGSPHGPVVLDRRRIELADPRILGSKQPYHAAKGLPWKQAEQLVKRCTEAARDLARRELLTVIGELQEDGHRVVACGVLLGSGRPVPSVAETLASHPLMHTAEGQLFRDALVYAGAQQGLPVAQVRERDLHTVVAAQYQVPMEQLARLATAMGKPLGAPWGQDEKQAALVAWLALSAAGR